MLVMAIIDENATEDMIPEDLQQQCGGRQRRAGRRSDQDQGARRGHRRRDPEPVTNLSGYHPGGITAVAEKLKPIIDGLNMPSGGKSHAYASLSDGMGATTVDAV